MSVRTTGAGRAAGALRAAVPALAAGLMIAGAAPPAAAEEAPVGCSGGTGDTAALVRAIRAGGTIKLSPGCTYTLRRAYGPYSALPTITRNTAIEGRNATIAYTGWEPVRSFFDIGTADQARTGTPSAWPDVDALLGPAYAPPSVSMPKVDVPNGGLLGGAVSSIKEPGGLRRAGARGAAAEPAAPDRLRLEVRDLRLVARGGGPARAVTVRREARVSLVNTSLNSGDRRAGTAGARPGVEIVGEGDQRCVVRGDDRSFVMDVRSRAPGQDSVSTSDRSVELQATVTRESSWGGGTGSVLSLPLGALPWTDWPAAGIGAVDWAADGPGIGGLLALGLDDDMATDARSCPAWISGRQISVSPTTGPVQDGYECCAWTGGTG
ncbi:hypothetical protein Arub01_23760 [Actinomadura rubrobrunea]|uniref:Secreted protein n=1 Tax=Actinomadura rubrobrunea TaxID=115335 RepID=A0A9W6PV12_9ACTN|nr:hypothetical protein [Actinomadura rubrobrunea]GLW64132.1 hypothetical protein Arub01_23760 [Actinomadura rubrobrunea]